MVDPQQWNARPLYNFIRGVGVWDGPIELHSAEGNLLVYDAISYSSQEQIQQLEKAHSDNDELIVQCKDGYVRVLINRR